MTILFSRKFIKIKKQPPNKIKETLKEDEIKEPKKVQLFENYAKKYKRIYPSP